MSRVTKKTKKSDYMRMKNCKVCGDKTPVVFNIAFKAVPICEGCARTITAQQVNWWVNSDRD